MKVLLVGSGAREHALAWKLNRSEVVEKLMFWPGGPAMGSEGEVFPYDGKSWSELAQTAKDSGVDLVVVGPEQPLSEGFADACNKISLPVFRSRTNSSPTRIFQIILQRHHEKSGNSNCGIPHRNSLKNAAKLLKICLPVPEEL